MYGGPSMNPHYTVGTRRSSLGISAWRNVAHRTEYESSSLFIEHWFKKRLPPTLTLQAGFLFQMLRKSERDDKGWEANIWRITCKKEGNEGDVRGAFRRFTKAPCGRTASLSCAPPFLQNLVQRAGQFTCPLVVIAGNRLILPPQHM